MTTPLAVRRRRARYRATHRGTKELDLMIGHFAEAHIDTMFEPALARFEQLLAMPDPDLDHWLRGGAEPDGEEMRGLIEEIRCFLGLTPAGT